ncbi:VOC family protein [Blastopirellula sp. JC732]|uniref:VOC family protein n=1 Tax=Blastopirellula sediminis TaxID=2894196 RepID=A0A9X1MNU8_9BACT|nr:VOC family protein [Blastopirellula sediminis]MCC9607020.1 VOC family protein [Blastopirellula sediminis]MCC9629687.1 VOC family protein [Blastopirellula sediminis]
MKAELFAVEIRTAEFETMLEWYKNVLQLKVGIRQQEEGYALLVGDGYRIALLSRDDAIQGQAIVSLAIEVDDFDVWRESLNSKSVPLVAQENREGFRELKLTDPDGNRVKLFAWR